MWLDSSGSKNQKGSGEKHEPMVFGPVARKMLHWGRTRPAFRGCAQFGISTRAEAAWLFGSSTGKSPIGANTSRHHRYRGMNWGKSLVNQPSSGPSPWRPEDGTYSSEMPFGLRIGHIHCEREPMFWPQANSRQRHVNRHHIVPSQGKVIGPPATAKTSKGLSGREVSFFHSSLLRCSFLSRHCSPHCSRSCLRALPSGWRT